MRRTKRAPRVAILAYHAVGVCPGSHRPHSCMCTSVAAFTSHMEFLRRHRRVVSLDDATGGRLPAGPPAVAITFDDGYQSVLENAVPVLERLGFPATMFVPTAWIGRQNEWASQTDCFPLQIMDEDELRESDRRGLWVESHGHGHIDLALADPSVLAEDLELSRMRLTEILGRPPRYLAYPYGRQLEATRAAAGLAGFEDAFLFDGVEGGRYARERVSVDGREGRVRLLLKTSGGYLARRRSPVGTAVGWLVREVIRRPVPG